MHTHEMQHANRHISRKHIVSLMLYANCIVSSRSRYRVQLEFNREYSEEERESRPLWPIIPRWNQSQIFSVCKLAPQTDNDFISCFLFVFILFLSLAIPKYLSSFTVCAIPLEQHSFCFYLRCLRGSEAIGVTLVKGCSCRRIYGWEYLSPDTPYPRGCGRRNSSKNPLPAITPGGQFTPRWRNMMRKHVFAPLNNNINNKLDPPTKILLNPSIFFRFAMCRLQLQAAGI